MPSPGAERPIYRTSHGVMVENFNPMVSPCVRPFPSSIYLTTRINKLLLSQRPVGISQTVFFDHLLGFDCGVLFWFFFDCRATECREEDPGLPLVVQAFMHWRYRSLFFEDATLSWHFKRMLAEGPVFLIIV